MTLMGIVHADLMQMLEMDAGMLTTRNMMKNAGLIINIRKIMVDVYLTKKESIYGLFMKEIIKRMKNLILKIISS